MKVIYENLECNQNNKVIIEGILKWFIAFNWEQFVFHMNMGCFHCILVFVSKTNMYIQMLSSHHDKPRLETNM